LLDLIGKLVTLQTADTATMMHGTNRSFCCRRQTRYHTAGCAPEPPCPAIGWVTAGRSMNGPLGDVLAACMAADEPGSIMPPLLPGIKVPAGGRQSTQHTIHQHPAEPKESSRNSSYAKPLQLIRSGQRLLHQVTLLQSPIACS
jgi:hypothetical protein